MLEILAASEEGLAASSIARSLGLSTSTLSLILTTLRELNYVERLPNRSYRLSFGVMRLLDGLRSRFPLLGVANDELARLFGRFNCGCSLARLGTSSQEVVLTVGSTGTLGIKPGVYVPLEPPLGTVAMAWQSPREIDQWLLEAPGTVNPMNEETQRAALSHVRQLGFAVYGIQQNAGWMIGQLRDALRGVQIAHSADVLHRQLDQLTMIVGARIYTVEELASRKQRGVSHVMAPVFGPDKRPRYLIALHPMRDSVSPDDLDRYVEELLRSAQALANQIGGRRPEK